MKKKCTHPPTYWYFEDDMHNIKHCAACGAKNIHNFKKMKKLIFETNEPTGEELINLPKRGIVRWLDYVTNRTFHKKGAYEQRIAEIEKKHPHKILIIINDNSNHGFVKRCYISFFKKNKMKRNRFINVKI